MECRGADGVNAAALALMAGVTVQLATASLFDWLSVLVGLVSLAVLVRWRVNSTWLVLGRRRGRPLHAFADDAGSPELLDFG